MNTSLLLLAAGDDVAVATRALTLGEVVNVTGNRSVTVRSSVPRGHKAAVVDRAVGEPVRKYGATVSRASTAIGTGDHVHIHNLEITEADAPHEFGNRDSRPKSSCPGSSVR